VKSTANTKAPKQHFSSKICTQVTAKVPEKFVIPDKLATGSGGCGVDRARFKANATPEIA
jgi:hypothetical protein